ncbi:glutaminase, partial [Micrococcus luteus]
MHTTLDEWVAQQTMSVMLTCGMYDASGQWVAEVG